MDAMSAYGEATQVFVLEFLCLEVGNEISQEFPGKTVKLPEKFCDFPRILLSRRKFHILSIMRIISMKIFILSYLCHFY